MPILRKGITATHPGLDYEGKKMFLIDIAIFPGSSGSPVLLVNQGSYPTRKGIIIGSRAKLLGIVYASIDHSQHGEFEIINVPTKQIPVPKMSLSTNLGCVIKAERIAELEDVVNQIYP